jgi:hypothetical protein
LDRVIDILKEGFEWKGGGEDEVDEIISDKDSRCPTPVPTGKDDMGSVSGGDDDASKTK